MSGFWSKEDAASTKPTPKPSYLNGDGQYFARIDVCKTGENRSKVKFACCEFTILADLTGNSHHKIGESVTVLVNQSNDYFMRDWLGFIQAVTGTDMTNATGDEKVEALEMVFGSENPLSGTLIEIHGHRRLKKDKDPDDPQNYYTIADWRREVPASEVADRLSESDQERFFPDGALSKLAAAQAQHEA